MSVHLGNTEIGQMYLGGTEIAQAYLGSTKVYEAGSPPPPQPTYITDGLVLHLDAIDRGTTDTDKWIDLVGNKIFTLYDCTIGTNYVQFNGSSSYGSLSSTWYYSDATIEVVAIAEGTGFAYCERGGGMMARITPSTQFVFRYNTASGRITASGVCNSANSIAAVVDGVDKTSLITGSDYSGNNQNVVTIGKRQHSTAGFFKGKIYSIREYSRKLTKAEMLQNQKVDNIRFNLGLSLPESI